MNCIVFYVSIFWALCDIGDSSRISLRRPVRSLSFQLACDPNQCAENLALCDGIKDCKNGCDENVDLCKSINPNSCILPETMQDKSYALNCDQNFTPQPGEYVPEMSLLSFACNPNYARLDGVERFQSLCLKGDWTPDISSCFKTCSKLNVPNISYKCYLDDEEIKCTDKHVIGTKLRTWCSLPYHHPNHNELVCNQYGEWDIKHIKCVPDCGIISDEAKLLYKDKYLPWHVLVRWRSSESSTLLRIGTLIAPNLVIVGVKGFTYSDNSKASAKNLEIIVNAFLDQKFQKSYKVKEIFSLPQEFVHSKNVSKETNDIAILALAENVEISATVLPVCIDTSGSIVSPSFGKVVVIGDQLDPKETYILNIETYDFNTCVSKIPKGTLPFDQFCGNVLSLETMGELDWGTGYYVEAADTHLYYIVGVYRLTFGIKGIKVFTSIAAHIEWINAIYKGTEAVEDYGSIEYHDCGKYSDEAKRLYNGNYLPWHVLVKRQNTDGTVDIDSGTLIAPNLVLKDARTFKYSDSTTISSQKFEVIVNGYLDEKYQKSYKVKTTFFTPKGFFYGSNGMSESNDIVIIQLTSEVEISPTVQPVCVDWTGVKLRPGVLPSVHRLIRMGDRQMLKSVQNNTRIVSMEAYELETCILKVANSTPPQYDQFCGKMKDPIKTDYADWGTGYFVENPKDRLFYIKGIYVKNYVAFGIKAFTDVATHIDWINAIYKQTNSIEEQNPKRLNHADHPPFRYGALELSCDSGELQMKFSRGCYIPINNASYFTYEVQCPFNPLDDLETYCKETTAGALVPEYSVLITNCKWGYASISKHMNKSVCLDGQWFPKLQPGIKTCRKLKPQGSFVKCSHRGELIDCDDTSIVGSGSQNLV